LNITDRSRYPGAN